MNDFESLFRQLDATGMAPPPTLQGLVLSLLLALTLGWVVGISVDVCRASKGGDHRL